MIAYKVCCVFDLKIRCYLPTMNDNSIFASLVGTGCGLHYKIGEITRPNFGRLFGFKTLDYAIQYMSSSNGCGVAILEGEASDIGQPKLIAKIECITQFWKLKKNHKKIGYENVLKAPQGTLTFSSFTPTKIVYEKNR